MANSQDKGTRMAIDDVFLALKAERDYQRRRWGYRQADGSMLECDHGVCDYLCYMQVYLAEAMRAATTVAGNDAALDGLRKVVALGIACFETHGIVNRDDADVLNGRDGLPS